MPIDTERMCMGCMRPCSEAVCPECGYSEETGNPAAFLQPRTLLAERYLVGRMLRTNGEGTFYLAYDTEEEVRVWLYEFFPRGVAQRGEDGTVGSAVEPETEYKTLVADFEALGRDLQKLSGATMGVCPVTDVFRANHTVYCVYRFLRVVDMQSLLRHNGEKLTWPQAKKLILTLCNTVAQVHKRGLLHRGISPQTVQIDQARRLYLSGFALYSLRTENSLLEPEIFHGYAAPEQYSASNWHGTWTDVYAVGALLYRMLTGVQPPDANSRLQGEALVPVEELVPEVPQHVAEAITLALELDAKRRLQTVDSFTVKLLEASGGNTAVFPASRIAAADPAAPAREEQPTGLFDPVVPQEEAPLSAREEKLGELKRYVLRPTLITAALVLPVVLIVVLLHACTGPKDPVRPGIIGAPPVYTIYEELVPMQIPKLVGKSLQSVQGDSSLTNRYELRYEYVYSDLYKADTIISQSIPAGTPVVNRALITLQVSRGPDAISVPLIHGAELENTMRLLTMLEIEFSVVEVADESWERGKIHHCEPAEGETIIRTQQELTVYVREEPREAPVQE